ncbi:hypothetical protein J0H58_19685 [bacterium]|nr:hypothetical protein [bacterium]
MTETPAPAEAPLAPPPAAFAPDDTPRRDIHPLPAAWRTDDKAASPARVFVVTLLLATSFAGLIVGLAALPRRPAPLVFVTLPVGEYDDPALPTNPWAGHDPDLLADRFDGTTVKAFGFQGAARFRGLLGWLGGEETAGLPRPDRRRPLVLHLTALGTIRGRTVYVLPADAAPDDPSNWVPLADVLRAAAARDVPHTLLLLDITRPAADPFGGPLDDDVSTAVHALLRANQPGFPVLVACGAGETALPADPVGYSAFAFYLAEGLGGAADGFADVTRPDGDVTVGELAGFLAARVDRWARLTHGRRQTPTLYAPEARGGDFVLARHPGAELTGRAPAAYPSWLRAAWAERDELRAGDRARRDPVAFARLTAGLLAAEERWWFTGSTSRAEEVWQAARAEWNLAAARVPQAPDWMDLPAVAARLPVARRGTPDPPPELGKALAAFLVAPPEKDAEPLTAWAAVARSHRAAAVGLIWALAVETAAPTAELVARWSRAAAAADPVNPLAETRVLTTIAAGGSFRRQRLAVYPAAAIAALFRAEDELGQLIALGPCEIDVSHARAEDLRTAARRLWTASSAADVAAATAALDRAADAYRTARARVTHARAGRVTLDDAVLALGETFAGMTEFDHPPAAAWLAVADAARPVATGSEASPPAVAMLKAATARLVSACDLTAVTRLTAPDRQATPANAAALRVRLAGAALRGPDRAKAWDALLADTARLHAAVRERDATDDTPPPPVPRGEPAAARRLRRAEASVRFIGLADAAAAQEADALLRRAMAQDSDVSWAALETRLRSAWLTELPAAARLGDATAARAVPPAAARHRVWAGVPAPAQTTEPYAAYRAWAETAARPTVTEDAP